MNEWNGKERRKMTQEYNELLARIDQNVTNLRDDFREHKDTVKQHITEDDVNFEKINQKLLWLTITVVIIAVSAGSLDVVAKFIK